jgi:DNA-binding MarR family transcriptional regulator
VNLGAAPLAEGVEHMSRTNANYETLGELTRQLRRFLQFRRHVAQDNGLSPREYLLMLEIKGLSREHPPNIAAVADRLQVAHSNAVELLQGLLERGLVRKQRLSTDRRQVSLSLTAVGERKLRSVVAASLEDVRAKGPALLGALRRAMNGHR